MNVIIALTSALILPFYHYTTLKIYQLSYYRLNEFVRSLLKKKTNYFVVGLLVPMIIFFACVILTEITKNYIYIVFFIVIEGVVVGAYSYINTKIKINFTARMIRFTALFVAISFALFVCLPIGYYGPVVVFLSPVTLVFAHLIITPIEKKRNDRFIKSAQERLNKINPIRIGITGSYGKTTAKNVLYEMLSQKYKTFATPQNYNTPMGIAKSIFQMPVDTQIFIVEMGARYNGDIEELCDIVTPQYGILTAIGNQHLETFGSEETLIQTKSALILSTKKGFCIVNGDSVDLTKISLQKNCIVSSKSSLISHYYEVKRSTKGTTFSLLLDGEKIEVETKLLGKHIPSCVCACACLSKILGIDAFQIKKAVSDLKAVAHRLELLYNGNDVIIDDAYNANEEGMKNALDVLCDFAPRTRVLITPGIIELGKEQYAVNKRMGEYAASRCDFALFIGKNGVALYDGATSQGMGNSCVFSTLSEALDKLKTIKGDRAILFENDLPDER